MDAPAPNRNRILTRELRRGLFIWAQALAAWSKCEPDARTAALINEVAKVLVRIANALAAYNGDGVIIPGDSRELPRSGNRPPHDFTT